jgi:hypothetical protein
MSDDDETEDAGPLQIHLADCGADPAGSIDLDQAWIEWLFAQTVPANVEGIDESISDYDSDAPNA